MTDFLHMLHDTQGLLTSVGLVGLGLIVFAETGILIGFFLPGDSLLFMAGMLAAAENPIAPLWLVCLTVGICAFVGNEVGYFLGKKVGPAIINSWAGRKIGIERVRAAEEFFVKHGASAVFLGRFIPIVRTLVPVLAGMNSMNYRKFSIYNLVGALVWGMGVPVAGLPSWWYPLRARQHRGNSDRCDRGVGSAGGAAVCKEAKAGAHCGAGRALIPTNTYC